jgi:hypothetical protein
MIYTGIPHHTILWLVKHKTHPKSYPLEAVQGRHRRRLTGIRCRTYEPECEASWRCSRGTVVA